VSKLLEEKILNATIQRLKDFKYSHHNQKKSSGRKSRKRNFIKMENPDEYNQQEGRTTIIGSSRKNQKKD
jgi:hypothetical protein